jgi:hypothetical protein
VSGEARTIDGRPIGRELGRGEAELEALSPNCEVDLFGSGKVAQDPWRDYNAGQLIGWTATRDMSRLPIDLTAFLTAAIDELIRSTVKWLYEIIQLLQSCKLILSPDFKSFKPIG